MQAKPHIPLDRWNPLPPAELQIVMRDAQFSWCLAGGYAIERFVGNAYRDHADTDISVFRPDQLALNSYLADWALYAADPPGHLRPWEPGEWLGEDVHDIWAFRSGRDSWELQIMLQEVEADSWRYRRHESIRGSLAGFSIMVGGVPCIRPEIQLLYKSKDIRKKDQKDFEHCLPKLDPASRCSLATFLREAYPEGHEWLARLAGS